jgi:hypothetical protein
MVFLVDSPTNMKDESVFLGEQYGEVGGGGGLTLRKLLRE